MRNNNFLKIVKSLRVASLMLLVMLVGAQTLDARSYGRPQTAAPVQKTELASATEARRALDNLGTQDFKGVRDARLRAASQRALAALKALAANKSNAREASLVANFDRTIKNLKALPQPANMSPHMCDASYERCIELCKETGGNCNLCGIAQNGCYLGILSAAIVNEHNPTKY